MSPFSVVVVLTIDYQNHQNIESKMADVEVRKGVKRSTSERDDQCSGQEEVHCEEPTSKFEKSEAKRWRCYSDFYNSDTGATIQVRYFRSVCLVVVPRTSEARECPYVILLSFGL